MTQHSGQTINQLQDSVKRAEESARHLTISEAMAEYSATRCFCGNHKKSMHSFCHFCYVTLPGYMKGNLFRGIREGYVEALAEAKEFLKLKWAKDSSQ